MLPHRVVLFCIGVSSVMALANACGDDFVTQGPPDSGNGGGVVNEGICPPAAPVADEPCVLPEGTTCAFDACGSRIARCLRNVWQYSGNPPPRPPCPSAPPTAETACPPCWPASVTCSYGSEDCSSPDASANQTVASCPSGAWVLEFSPCAADAGADVQGDGDAGND